MTIDIMEITQRVDKAKDILRELTPLTRNEDAFEDNRKGYNVILRDLIARVLRDEGYTHQAIAEALGKDHSTIAYAINRINGELISDLPHCRMIRDLYTELSVKMRDDFVAHRTRPHYTHAEIELKLRELYLGGKLGSSEYDALRIAFEL